MELTLVVFVGLIAAGSAQELLPLQGLDVAPRGDTVNISFVKPNASSPLVADNIEVIICEVLEPTCLEPLVIPIEEDSCLFKGLKLGTLYNVSACLTRMSGDEKHSSPALSINFTSMDPDDASGAGYNVTGDGVHAELNLWWEEEQCDNSSVSYSLAFCRRGFNCSMASTENTNYTLRNSEVFPVLFWNGYYVNISKVCAGESLKLHELYSNTGPGELLPLQNLIAVPNLTAVNLTFVKPDAELQDAADSVEVTVCDVTAQTCSETKRVPIAEPHYNLGGLTKGVLYNVSARLTKSFDGKNYTSQQLSAHFTAENPDDAPKSGFEVSNGTGAYPEVSIWWEKYQCDEHPAFYIISICRNGAVCTDARTASTNYTLRTSDRFPVVRWSDYRVNITGLCGAVSAELQEFHVDTGAGDLLPPSSLTAVPRGDSVVMTLVKPDIALQNAAEGVEVLVCDLISDRCLDPRIYLVNQTSYRFEGLGLGVPYNVSVRFTKSFQGQNYTSESVSAPFATIDPDDASKVGFNKTAQGPYAEIDLWWEPYECDKGPTTYRLKMSRNRLNTINVMTKLTKFKLKKNFNFPVLFWDDYYVMITAVCGGSSVKLQEFWVDTGSGELLPLQDLRAEVDGNAVNITITPPEIRTQNVSDAVEVTVCDVLASFCLDSERIPTDQKRHRVEKLEYGVLYNVSARLIKTDDTGENFTSQSLTTNFTTALPDEREYPPIENITVKMDRSRYDGFATVTISCSKPADTRGKVFTGIYTELYDHLKKRVTTVDPYRDTTLLLPTLSLFQNFTVTVHALYGVHKDLVQAVGARKTFFTRVGDLVVPAPEIVELIAIDGASVWLRWANPATTPPYSFKVTRKQLSTNETTVVNNLPPDTRSLLVRDLEPEETYSFSVTAFFEGDKLFENSSDARELTTLAKDALVPTLKIEKLEPANQLRLNWTALISPEARSHCHLLALACPDDAQCLEKNITDTATVSTTFDIYPYTNYTVRLRTRCIFEDQIHVFADSNIEELVSDQLKPVIAFKHHAINETAVALSWDVSTDQAYTGFNVRWSLIGGDGSWSDTSLGSHEFDLTSLQVASSYHVSVEGVRAFGKKNFTSSPVNTVVYPKFPVPPEVETITAAQEALTSRVTLSWPKVDFTHAPVYYEVESTCADAQKFSTKATDVEFTAKHLTNLVTDCFVTVAACTKDLREKELCAPTTGETFLFKILAEPKEVEAFPSSDKIYDVKVTVPSPLKETKDLEYQIADESGIYGPRFRVDGKGFLKESRYDQLVSRKARLCINDLLGKEHSFSFQTNTGAPGEVTSLGVDVDVTTLNIKWNKPKTTNGPIDGYLVDVAEKGTDNVVSKDSKENFLTIVVDNEYTSYDVTVTAFNLDKVNSTYKKSGPGLTATVTTEGVAPPPPRNLRQSNSNHYSRLQWEKTPNTRFNVTCFRIVANSTKHRVDVISDKTEFPFSELYPYTVYEFQVSSCSANRTEACGKPARTLPIRTDVGYPSVPSIQLVEKNISMITIHWTVPEEANGPINGYQYAYDVKSSGVSPFNWQDTQGQERFQILTNLSANTEYLITVRAYNLAYDGELRASSAGELLVSTEGAPKGPLLVVLVSVAAAIVVSGLAFFVYTRYVKRARNTPLISVGPQNAASPTMEEVDL